MPQQARVRVCESPGMPIESAQAITVLKPYALSANQKMTSKEEANVEFQRCGPQNT